MLYPLLDPPGVVVLEEVLDPFPVGSLDYSDASPQVVQRPITRPESGVSLPKLSPNPHELVHSDSICAVPLFFF